MAADGHATRGSFSSMPTNARLASGLDGLGAITSGVASRMSSGPAQTLVATASGALWGGSGVASQWSGASRVDSVINATAGLAGTLSSASALASQFQSKGDPHAANLGYASSATWVLGGAVTMAKGAWGFFKATSRREQLHTGLTALSGALNIAGAGLSMSATSASAREDTATAALHGTLSSAAWLGGTLAGVGAAYFAPLPAPRAVQPLQQVVVHPAPHDGPPRAASQLPTESTPLRSAPIPIPARKGPPGLDAPAPSRAERAVSLGSSTPDNSPAERRAHLAVSISPPRQLPVVAREGASSEPRRVASAQLSPVGPSPASQMGSEQRSLSPMPVRRARSGSFGSADSSHAPSKSLSPMRPSSAPPGRRRANSLPLNPSGAVHGSL